MPTAKSQFPIQLSAFHFVALEATRADVSGFNLSVFYDFHFLYVRFESSPRLAVAVADIVARSLALVADAAHSRHISHLHGRSLAKWAQKAAPLKTSINTIPKRAKKINRFCVFFRKFSSKIKKWAGSKLFPCKINKNSIEYVCNIQIRCEPIAPFSMVRECVLCQ